jgi:hypothetical protein
LFPLATSENGPKVAGASEQVGSQTASPAPPLRKFWNAEYIWTST